MTEKIHGHTYYKLKCRQCNRKILVEMFMFGTIHHHSPSATCAECLKKTGITKEFQKQSSKVSQDIEEWINEED